MEKDLMNNNPDFTVNKKLSREVMDDFYNSASIEYIGPSTISIYTKLTRQNVLSG